STMPVKEALMHVKEQAPDAETIYVRFAGNEHKQLAGVLSLRDLIVAENDAYIEDTMSERVISANAADDQEDVAQKVRNYDFIVAVNDAYIEDIMSERVISANAADDQVDVAQ